LEKKTQSTNKKKERKVHSEDKTDKAGNQRIEQERKLSEDTKKIRPPTTSFRDDKHCLQTSREAKLLKEHLLQIQSKLQERAKEEQRVQQTNKRNESEKEKNTRLPH
jgi:hypothetical protein